MTASEPDAGPHGRRTPTASEARALSHPLRLRILFACRDRARTNKELAAALGSTPGTIHHHLKPLVAEGFLRAEEPRPGPRGSVEQPYRSTGKSWLLDDAGRGHPMREVATADLLAASPEDIVSLSRLGMTLGPDDLEDLTHRLQELLEEFKERGTPADGIRPEDAAEVTLLIALHRTET